MYLTLHEADRKCLELKATICVLILAGWVNDFFILSLLAIMSRVNDKLIQFNTNSVIDLRFGRHIAEGIRKGRVQGSGELVFLDYWSRRMVWLEVYLLRHD